MYPPTKTPRRRTARTLLVVVLVGLALVAGVVLWQAESPATVQPGASPTDSSSPQDPAATGYLPPAVPAADPVASAVAWLQATRSLSFADGAPSSWTARARPVVTDRLAAGYARLRDGGAGADWTDFVAAGCVSVVTDADGVIPLEAPAHRGRGERAGPGPARHPLSPGRRGRSPAAGPRRHRHAAPRPGRRVARRPAALLSS